MAHDQSILQALMQNHSNLRPQVYLKSALTALSHALEDLILAGVDAPLVIANCQHERIYRREDRRYRQITQHTDQVYIFATPERESGLAVNTDHLETIPLNPEDPLVNEWQLLIIGKQFSACLVCQALPNLKVDLPEEQKLEGIWTFDREICAHTAHLLIQRIVQYRPELQPKLQLAVERCHLNQTQQQVSSSFPPKQHSSIFGQRLLTYLQASQYKLLKVNRMYQAQALKEQLINRMTTAIRQSLSPEIILQTAVQELGPVFEHCRCILYRCHPKQTQVTLSFEYVDSDVLPLKGQVWDLSSNPLIQVALLQERATAVTDVSNSFLMEVNPSLQNMIQRYQIKSWLLAPILHQGQIQGMMELQYTGEHPYRWLADDISLVEAIATQAGVALAQAEAFTASTSLNEKLQEIEKTQTSLINIIGHELRTPLSTIQVFLESLQMEPQMPVAAQKTMLEMAMTDTDRMQQLIQDFMCLFRLQHRQVPLQPEAINFEEALSMALSGLRLEDQEELPQIHVELPQDLPTLHINADGLIEVLDKLLSNACKFTPAKGQVTIEASIENEGFTHWTAINSTTQSAWLTVNIKDTGRGIEPNQLQTIFKPFYQEEDYLRRSAGGAGLGLAICDQWVTAMKGKIWAESAGRDQGSIFHIALPVEMSFDSLNRDSQLIRK